jgi:hypothetical protein
VALYYKSMASAKAKQAAAGAESSAPAVQLDREPLLPAGKGSPGPKRGAPWDVEASARMDSIPALRKD